MVKRQLSKRGYQSVFTLTESRALSVDVNTLRQNGENLYRAPLPNMRSKAFTFLPQKAMIEKQRRSGMEDVRSAPVKRQKSGKAAVIIYILLGILAFTFSLCMSVQLIARNILAQSVVSDTISDMNPADWELGMFWEEKDIKDFVREWYFPETITADSTIAEALKDTSESVGTHIEIAEVREMFKETGIMPSLGSILKPYERYLLTGNDENIFSPGDVMNEFKNITTAFRKV